MYAVLCSNPAKEAKKRVMWFCYCTAFIRTSVAYAWQGNLLRYKPNTTHCFCAWTLKILRNVRCIFPFSLDIFRKDDKLLRSVVFCSCILKARSYQFYLRSQNYISSMVRLRLLLFGYQINALVCSQTTLGHHQTVKMPRWDPLRM